MTGLGGRLSTCATRVVWIPFPFDLASADAGLRMSLDEQAQGGFYDCFLCG
jgi:hypothetical protein